MFHPDALEAIAKQAEEADWTAAVSNVLTNPTTDGLLDLSTFENRMNSVNEGLGRYSDGQRVRNLDAAVAVSGLLHAGKLEQAEQQLLARRKMLLGKESTEITDALLGHVRSRDPERLARARGMAGMVIALAGGDRAPQILERMGFGKPTAGKFDVRPDDWSSDQTGAVA